MHEARKGVMPEPASVRDLQEAMAGEWNTPRPIVFKPDHNTGAVRSSAGNLQLFLASTKRDGKLQRLVTLKDASDGYTISGCATHECTRIRWENGAVWSKVPTASRLQFVDTGRRLQAEEERGKKGASGCGSACSRCSCSFWACSSSKKAAGPKDKTGGLGQELPVELISARGLRNADWTSTPDVYCTCKIQDKPGAISFRTPCISSVNPVWNYTGLLRDYCVGDSIEIHLWDKDLLGTREPLGKVVLPTRLFHPNGFEGEVPIREAGEGVRAFLAVDIVPASEMSGRKLMLSDRQVENVVERVNEHLDVPLVPESWEGQALSALVGTVNRRLRGALLTFCDRGWVNAMELLLDESLDRKTKGHEVAVVLRHSFRNPLAKALTGIVNSVIDTPGFFQEKLLQVNKYLVNQLVEELIDGAIDGLEDVGLSLSMADEDRRRV